MLLATKQTKKLINESCKYYSAALAAHRAAVKAGEHALAEGLVWGPLCTREAFIAPLVVANAKLHPGKRRQVDELVDIAFAEAGKIGKAPLSESVHLHPIPKKDGTHRMTLEFGLRHKAVQIVLADLVSHDFKPKPWQFGYGKEKGVQAAVKAVRSYLEAGYTHYARLDVKEFFPSFEVKSLSKSLPLPKELVANAIVGKHLRIKQAKFKTSLKTSGTENGVELDEWKYAKMPWVSSPHSPSTLHLQISEARRGIAQGSIVSPLIGSFTISRLSIPSGLVVANYADDFAVFAKSKAELAEHQEALIESIASLPGGKFKLRPKQSGELLMFLGHEFYETKDGVTVSPSEDAKGAMVARYETLTTELLDFCSPKTGKKQKKEAAWRLAKLQKFLDGWSAAFSACDNIEEYTKGFYDDLADWADYCGINQEAIAQEAVTCEVDLGLDYDLSFQLH